MAFIPITIEQRISAGNQFDGSAPASAGTDDTSTGIRTFAAASAGGLFTYDVDQLWVYEVRRISGDFADATSVSISIVNTAGDEVFIYDAAGVGGDVLITDRIQVAPDEKIKVVTAGATAEMVVRVMARPLVMIRPIQT